MMLLFSVTQAFRKKRSDINDDTEMLNKLLNRKKAPSKKKKKPTTTSYDEGNHMFVVKVNTLLIFIF